MKTPLLFAFLLSISCALFGQDDRPTNTMKNAIWLEVYQAIRVDGMRHFYNDDWLLQASTNHTRSNQTFAFGLAYERVLANNIVLRPRIGITRREVSEQGFSEQRNPLAWANCDAKLYAPQWSKFWDGFPTVLYASTGR